MFFDQIVKLEKEINNSKLYREQSCVFLGQNFKILKWGLSWDILGAKSGQCCDILIFICVRMLHKISRFETYGPKCRTKSDLWIRALNSVRYVCIRILWSVIDWSDKFYIIQFTTFPICKKGQKDLLGWRHRLKEKTLFVMDWHLRHFLKCANLAARTFLGRKAFGNIPNTWPTPQISHTGEKPHFCWNMQNMQTCKKLGREESFDIFPVELLAKDPQKAFGRQESFYIPTNTYLARIREKLLVEWQKREQHEK